MFLIDGRNFFLSFWTSKARDGIYSKLLSKTQNSTDESVSGVYNPGGGSVLQQAIFGGSPLNELTQKWASREISNLAYLMHLNTLAGRSYNDLTQYPTFPWVVADYDSEELDLHKAETFRNLALPMGGQGCSRAEQFRERFETWDDPSIPGCHYGTHYSSSMIVCSFLIRMEPFTQQYLKLQGGHFDHPDRLFHSIPQSWNSASKLNTTDVRELIPEFYYLPQLLLNLNSFNFGKKQTGDLINDVVLPNWAKKSPYLFIKLHREALESEYVSENIHQWIDLVFGYKQHGDEAAKSLNIFHYLSYEGAVDMDKIEDPIEKQSTISIIHNFGQTPKQLFKKPHQKRNNLGGTNLRIDKDFRLLIQSISCLKDLEGRTASDIRVSTTGQLLVIGSCSIFVPHNYSKYLEWGHLDDSVRIFQYDSNKEVAVFESLHIGKISCAIFADNECLITGGEDTTVCLWNFVTGKRPSVDLEACLRGHRKQITTLATSRSYSVIISGSDDCNVIIWDLNRHQYVRCLEGHQNAIRTVSISDNTGDIVTCDGSVCMLWDINGTLLARKNIAQHNEKEDIANVCVVFEGRPAEVFDTDLIFSGHDTGKIRIWKKMFNEDGLPWKLELVHVLESRFTHPIDFISFSVSMKTIFTGDSSGKVTSWNLPDGSQTELHFANNDTCIQCKTKFAVLGRKAYCKACGACVLPTCLNNVPEQSFKLCNNCFSIYCSSMK
jgi:beige protein homolog 1